MKELMDTGASLPLKAALAYEYTTSHAQIIRPSIGVCPIRSALQTSKPSFLSTFCI